MRLWVDDIRPAPEGYRWIKSVNEAKDFIEGIEEIFDDNYFLYNPSTGEKRYVNIELIDLDYDSGDYEKDGGPYIKLMDWLVETNRMYSLAFHSQNSVGLAAMKRMYRRYWLKETL